VTTTQIITPVFQVGTFPTEAGPCCCGGGEPPGETCCPDLPASLTVRLTSDDTILVTLTYVDALPNVSDTPPGWQAEYEGGTIEFYCLQVQGNWEWFFDDAEGGVSGSPLVCCGRVSFTGTLHGDVYIDLPACDDEPPGDEDCCTDRPSTLKITYTMGGCCAGVTLEFTATEYTHSLSATYRGWRWDPGGRGVWPGYTLIALCLPDTIAPYAAWTIRLVDPAGNVSWTGSPIATANSIDCGAGTFSAVFPSMPAGSGFAADCPACSGSTPTVQITITDA